jgi:hypothetical protein
MSTLAPITAVELENESASLLPTREALSVNLTSHWANVSATNLSMAINAASFGSDATAHATQSVAIFQ